MRTENFTALDGLYHGWRAPEAGQPTIAFANSLGTDLRVWDRVVAGLPESWGILRHDKRGHGLSQAGDQLSIASMAGDLAGLLAHYNVTDYVAVGLSVGGLIMQQMAISDAAGMRQLVLADTAAKIGNAELWNARIDTVLRDGISAIGDAILERWFADGYAETEDFAMWRLMLERTPAKGYAQVCAAIRDADLTEGLGAIGVPTLVLAGAEDKSTPPDLVRATADLIPGARFVTIARAGHLPCVEQPEAFVQLLRDHVGA